MPFYITGRDDPKLKAAEKAQKGYLEFLKSEKTRPSEKEPDNVDDLGAIKLRYRIERWWPITRKRAEVRGMRFISFLGLPIGIGELKVYDDNIRALNRDTDILKPVQKKLTL